MNATDTRATIGQAAPYIVIIACMAFAKWGVDTTIISLIAGGCLAAIDPRRGQASPSATLTTGDQTTINTQPPP